MESQEQPQQTKQAFSLPDFGNDLLDLYFCSMAIPYKLNEKKRLEKFKKAQILYEKVQQNGNSLFNEENFSEIETHNQKGSQIFYEYYSQKCSKLLLNAQNTQEVAKLYLDKLESVLRQNEFRMSSYKTLINSHLFENSAKEQNQVFKVSLFEDFLEKQTLFKLNQQTCEKLSAVFEKDYQGCVYGRPIQNSDIPVQQVSNFYHKGGIYEGSLSQDQKIPHGFGKLSWTKNNYSLYRLYEGNFINGSEFGNCKIQNYGDKFEGDIYKLGQNGFGAMKLESGASYIGQIIGTELRQVGFAKITQHGKIYIGQVDSGNRCGYGFEILQNGQRYEGYWSCNKKSGFGILYDRDGSILQKGEWKNDQFQKENEQNN